MRRIQSCLEIWDSALTFRNRPYAVATAVPTFIMELDMEEIISEIAVNLWMYSMIPSLMRLMIYFILLPANRLSEAMTRTASLNYRRLPTGLQ